MKKVVVVSGSPRKKGNTMSMVKKYEEYIKGIENDIEFEYVYLIKQNLKYCTGCGSCIINGIETCPIKDDREKIFGILKTADGFVFSTPGYTHSISALFKNFLDRFMWQYHLPDFFGKPVTLISTVGGDGGKATAKYMHNMGLAWWGCNVLDNISIAHAFYMFNDKYKKKIDNKLNIAAEKMLDRLNSSKPMHPTFLEYIYYAYNLAELDVSDTCNPARTKLWKEKGWLDKESHYYYDVKIKFSYRLIARVLRIATKIGFRIMLGKDADSKLRQYTENF